MSQQCQGSVAGVEGWPFTKSLAQILSRDIGLGNNVAKRKGYFKTITLT